MMSSIWNNDRRLEYFSKQSLKTEVSCYKTYTTKVLLTLVCVSEKNIKY